MSHTRNKRRVPELKRSSAVSPQVIKAINRDSNPRPVDHRSSIMKYMTVVFIARHSLTFLSVHLSVTFWYCVYTNKYIEALYIIRDMFKTEIRFGFGFLKTEPSPNRPKIWHPFRRFFDRNCVQIRNLC